MASEANLDDSEIDGCREIIESICESIGELTESFSERGEGANLVCDQGKSIVNQFVIKSEK